MLVVFASLACNRITNPRPSNAEIEQAIMKTGVSNLIVGRIPLRSVSVERIGTYNDQQKYWPVRAKIVTRVGEERILDWVLSRNDYGEWVARRAER
jgi:hypothetical protein